MAGPAGHHGYNGLMQKATISQLKNHLSAYLDRVRSGETLLICDRDLPIARIERIGAELLPASERLLKLQRAGLLRQATRPVPLELLRARAVAMPAMPGRGVLQALLDERADGR